MPEANERMRIDLLDWTSSCMAASGASPASPGDVGLTVDGLLKFDLVHVCTSWLLNIDSESDCAGGGGAATIVVFFFFFVGAGSACSLSTIFDLRFFPVSLADDSTSLNSSGLFRYLSRFDCAPL